jgi:hypothetical protein
MHERNKMWQSKLDLLPFTKLLSLVRQSRLQSSWVTDTRTCCMADFPHPLHALCSANCRDSSAIWKLSCVCIKREFLSLNTMRFSCRQRMLSEESNPYPLDLHAEDDLMDKNYFTYCLGFDPHPCHFFKVFKELLLKRLVTEICFEFNIFLWCNNKERRLEEQERYKSKEGRKKMGIEFTVWTAE